MKILCLDQSTKVTGYSVWVDGKLNKYGHLDSKIKENNPIKRMKKMIKLIDDVIGECSPDYIVIEGVQFQKNYNTYSQLSQMQGVIFCSIFQWDIPFSIIQPTMWKSFCDVKGKKRAEQKANTIKMVKEKFNLDVTEDEADSIGIGLWAVDNVTLEDK